MSTPVPDFDPVLQDVPQPGLGATVLSPDELRLIGYTFTNNSGALRKVRVTDAAGKAFLFDIDVPPSGIPVSDGWPYLHVIGVKWGADGAGVVGKLWGYKTWPF